jgi:kilA protein, putative phage-related DNA binding protein|nr:MAG TPA: repressor domain protein [Caudoviricetes sp.]
MANQISVLKQTELCGQQFMVYGSAQEPLFVASDVAAMLNHPNTSELVKLVDDDEKLTSTILRSGQNREVWMLTENGLYEVLMQSRKPIAKQFKKGVKAILKEIRKTGGYLAITQEDTPELIMARALQVAQATITKHQQMLEQANERIALQDTQLKQQAPKVKYVDDVLQSVNTYTSTQMAKELGLREAEQLHKILKDKGIMFKQSGQWLLTAKYSEKGYTKSRTYQFTRNDGSIGTSTTTVWTEKGRAFLHYILEKVA